MTQYLNKFLNQKVYKWVVSSNSMKIKCKKCEHEWEYKGKSKFYVTCPHCYNKINIQSKKDE